jgi:hypothetical protein
MATLRKQIVEAVRAALGGPGKPTGLTVVSRSAPPSEEDQLPRVAVARVREEVEKKHDRYPVVERRLTVRLDFWVGGDEPEDDLEPLLAWGTTVMLTDPSWSKLAIDTNEQSTEWDVEQADSPFGRASAEYVIRYVTKTGNQEVKQ